MITARIQRESDFTMGVAERAHLRAEQLPGGNTVQFGYQTSLRDINGTRRAGQRQLSLDVRHRQWRHDTPVQFETTNAPVERDNGSVFSATSRSWGWGSASLNLGVRKTSSIPTCRNRRAPKVHSPRRRRSRASRLANGAVSLRAPRWPGM